MAKKSLGVTELEWVCPTCNTRNPGSSRTCSGCGTPQPPDVQFVAPGAAAVTKDEAVVKQATAAPDIHCPYCDARNPAGAKVCKQCGGDLTTAEARKKGELVTDFSTTGPGVVKCTTCGTENPANLTTCKNCGAPLPRIAKPAPAPVAAPKGNSSCLYIVIGVVVVVVLGIFLMFMFGGGGGERINSVGKVVDGRWTRTIMILGLRPRQYTGWLDDIPADATIGACRDEVRDEVDEPVPNSIEVCGTPYAVDQGTGFAEVVQDCVYQVLEQQCEFEVNEWMPVDTVTQEGSGIAAIWPSLDNRVNDTTQRQGQREEEYQCTITANDKTFVYETSDFAKYQHCVAGAEWNIVTTESGQLISAAPVE